MFLVDGENFAALVELCLPEVGQSLFQIRDLNQLRRDLLLALLLHHVKFEGVLMPEIGLTSNHGLLVLRLQLTRGQQGAMHCREPTLEATSWLRGLARDDALVLRQAYAVQFLLAGEGAAGLLLRLQVDVRRDAPVDVALSTVRLPFEESINDLFDLGLPLRFRLRLGLCTVLRVGVQHVDPRAHVLAVAQASGGLALSLLLVRAERVQLVHILEWIWPPSLSQYGICQAVKHVSLRILGLETDD